MSKPPKTDRNHQRHGLYAVRDAVRALEAEQRDHWLDALGDTGQALRDWRDAILADLCGPEAVSSQERAIVELATKTYLMLESIDRFLLEQPSLVNKSRRQLFPVVLQRQQIADSLARYMTMLGLQRRTKALPSLGEYLATRTNDEAGSAAPPECNDHEQVQGVAPTDCESPPARETAS